VFIAMLAKASSRGLSSSNNLCPTKDKASLCNLLHCAAFHRVTISVHPEDLRNPSLSSEKHTEQPGTMFCYKFPKRGQSPSRALSSRSDQLLCSRDEIPTLFKLAHCLHEGITSKWHSCLVFLC
jgi:hypothetical protein